MITSSFYQYYPLKYTVAMDGNAGFQESTPKEGVLSLRTRAWRKVRARPPQRTIKDGGGSQESQRKEK